jgi:hypothetical protein
LAAPSEHWLRTAICNNTRMLEEARADGLPLILLKLQSKLGTMHGYE